MLRKIIVLVFLVVILTASFPPPEPVRRLDSYSRAPVIVKPPQPAERVHSQPADIPKAAPTPAPGDMADVYPNCRPQPYKMDRWCRPIE